MAKNRKWGHPCPMDTFLVSIWIELNKHTPCYAIEQFIILFRVSHYFVYTLTSCIPWLRVSLQFMYTIISCIPWLHVYPQFMYPLSSCFPLFQARTLSVFSPWMGLCLSLSRRVLLSHGSYLEPFYLDQSNTTLEWTVLWQYHHRGR